MTTPVGITVPKLLPITGTFAPAFAAYYLLLSGRVSNLRVKHDKYIGDKSAASDTGSDPLLVAARSQQNFAENVPFAVLIGAIVEINGGNRKVLTGGLAALLLFRIMHVELGLRGEGAKAPGRLVGHLGSMGFIVGMAGYAGYLVKGYWGY